MLGTRKINNPQSDSWNQRVVQKTTRAAKRRLTVIGIAGVALATILAVGVLSMLGPFRNVLDWIGDAGQRIGRIVSPEEERIAAVEAIFATNFEEVSILGEASFDIVVQNQQIVRKGDLFGLGESTQTIDLTVANVRWVVYWRGAEIDEKLGRLTIHLPEAEFGGIWVLAEDLSMSEYDANVVASFFDLFNGVDSPDSIQTDLIAKLNEEAARHEVDLKRMAEAAAERTLFGILTQQDLTATVVFDR